MKIKRVQGIICLTMIFLFAKPGWAADWVLFTTSAIGNMYYDKSSIIKVTDNNIHVWTDNLLNETGKTDAFAFLNGLNKAPNNPNVLGHVFRLSEVDCVNEKMKDSSTIIYDQTGAVIYSSPKESAGEWNKILPNSVAERLKNIVCEKPVASNEAAAAPKVVEPVVPKVETPAAAIPAVPDKKTAQAVSQQDGVKALREQAIRNLVNQWLASWQSGDMSAYRGYYAVDFQSKGMNLDAWISYKENVKKKSQDISISIDKLQISADEHKATAEFIQSYSSSILKDSGKKILELIKVNGEWKIIRETM